MYKKFKPRGKFYRINYFIQAPKLRLLDESGKQIGILTKAEALTIGREKGIDVVEIAAHAVPPVAKLIDFKKFKYLEAKKLREEKKKQKHIQIKEIRLRPFIGEHDLEVRVRQAQEFLIDGDQIKISLPFRGREITHQEFGRIVIDKFLNSLKGYKIVRPSHLEGKTLVTFIVADNKSEPKQKVKSEPDKNSLTKE